MEKKIQRRIDDLMSYKLGSVIQTLSAEAVKSLKTFEQKSEVRSAGLPEYETSSTMFSTSLCSPHSMCHFKIRTERRKVRKRCPCIESCSSSG